MQRRNFLATTAVAAGALTLLSKRSLASLIADPTYQFKPLRSNMGIFTERGGTIAWLSNKDGIVVVDAEFADTAPHVIAELQKQSTLPFQWLINTHHHGDHTGGNIAFKGLAKNVAAHQNSLINQKAVAVKANAEDKQLYPNITFADQWKTKVGDETIRAHYWGPGHTNGDAMIHFENANIVHTGDLVFNRMYPYIDRTAGASVKNWAVVLEKAQKQFDKNTLFVFGHAYDPVKVTGSLDDLKAMQNYVEKLAAFVSGEIKAGKSKDDILKATSIPGVTEWQGDGIQRSLSAAYDEFSI
ncbi:MBL fold metallo-hydrolase [Mucilaginibacter sp.]|uniref:MBL fold metallo-hydrolase n=1 Tax=Mucilaginibacter sp. TaxID=1882438 RepID=UPI00260A4FD2|nr:MBL fold metallo-hydrolase [Mucilaginibacter sp.]MDB5031729.1 fold metallo-hydrolase [Mucilaginibacter sp.]